LIRLYFWYIINSSKSFGICHVLQHGTIANSASMCRIIWNAYRVLQTLSHGGVYYTAMAPVVSHYYFRLTNDR